MSRDLDEALEGALDELEDMFEQEREEAVVSRSELLAAYMTSLSFRPKTPRADGTMEYYRVYTDPSGRVGRTVAVIKKDDVGLEPRCVDYFTVTVQIHVPATEEGVDAKAPAFAKPDLLRILAHFDDVIDRSEIGNSECSECGVSAADFMENPQNGKLICLPCAQRKGIL